MGRAAPPSEQAILNRRRQLRGQKRLKFLISTWRTLAISGLAGSLLWLASLPRWVIHRPNQVTIRGNHTLSGTAIQALLPLQYPQSLFRLQPQVLASTLETALPIQKALITRQLFPPQVILEVQEQAPIAKTLCVGAVNPMEQRCILRQDLKPTPVQQGPAGIWLLDSRGRVAPLSSYPHLQTSGKLPTLTVLGLFTPAPPAAQKQLSKTDLAVDSPLMTLTQARQTSWAMMYRQIRQSPIKITTVDWRSANNLILETELGRVRLGPYNESFPEQLKALTRMEKLPRYVNPQQVLYIDLTNPERPLIQVREAGKAGANNQQPVPPNP